MAAGNQTTRWLLVLILIGACASLAHAEFGDDYETGLKALDSGHLDEARQYLRKALSAQPTPVDKVRLNANDFQPYLPYHFLGMVAYKQGDCSDAAAQWDNATNKRMLGRLNQLRKQEVALLATCQQKASVADVAKPSVPAVVEKPVVVEPAAAQPDTTVKSKPNAQASNAAPAKKANGDRPDPPPALVEAFNQFLAGRYREVIALDPEAFSRSRAKYQAYLIRAAARFTQAQIDGSKDLDATRADVRAALAIDSRSALDAGMFSPRFRSFFGEAQQK